MQGSGSHLLFNPLAFLLQGEGSSRRGQLKALYVGLVSYAVCGPGISCCEDPHDGLVCLKGLGHTSWPYELGRCNRRSLRGLYLCQGCLQLRVALLQGSYRGLRVDSRIQ